jgi:subtilase family serine protease
VNSDVVTTPVYEITATPVEVEFGATSFNVTAEVTNTNNIAAENVEVSLFYNGVIATQTVSVAANATATVTFNNVENPFTKAGTYTMYVQAPNAQAEVAITVKPEPVQEVIDLAVTAIQGTLSLDVETSYLTVFVENKGTKDVTNARVALTAGNAALGEANVSVKAGNTGFCTIAVTADKLTAGEFTVVATVTAEGEAQATLDDNTLEKTYTIAAAQPTFELTVESEVTGSKNKLTVEIPFTVKNTSNVDAEMVKVAAYLDGSELGSITIQKLEANSETSDVIEIATGSLNVGKNQILVMVGNVTKWVNVTISETTAIAAIKAIYGHNVQIYTLAGVKVNDVRPGNVYIINGKKVAVK